MSNEFHVSLLSTPLWVWKGVYKVGEWTMGIISV